jgi:NAD(P)-dependent dehydrogenase (short-subunit alcohol dehydrogenase family)
VPVYPVKADLAIPAQVESMFTAIDGLPHRLTLLVNSAALMTPSNLLTMNVDDWNQVFDLNTRAVWLCSRAAASRMTLGGLILNLSDVGARKNWTRYGGYVVSKAAVESLTRVLARQLAPRVRVCAIAPGLLMQAEGQSAEEWERLVDKVPLRRPADPIELLSAIDFLIGNHYITGEVINLAGGYQLV